MLKHVQEFLTRLKKQPSLPPTSKKKKKPPSTLKLLSTFEMLRLQPTGYSLTLNKALKTHSFLVDEQGRFHMYWSAEMYLGLFPSNDGGEKGMVLPAELLLAQEAPPPLDESEETINTLEDVEPLGEGIGFSQASEALNRVEAWSPISQTLPPWQHASYIKLVWALSGNELTLQSLLVEGLPCLDEFKQQGLLVQLNKRWVVLPYWLKQVIEQLPTWNALYQTDSKTALAWLQALETWIHDTRPAPSASAPTQVQWVLEDARLSVQRLFRFSTLDIHAVDSLHNDQHTALVDLIPFSRELHTALGYTNETESKQVVQRALRNWQPLQQTLTLDCAKQESTPNAPKQVVLQLNEVQQEALLFLQREASNKPSQTLLETLRFPPENSMRRQAPNLLLDAFNLDINHYGERVVGIGTPQTMAGAYGSAKYTSVLEIDELVVPNDTNSTAEPLSAGRYSSVYSDESTGTVLVTVTADDGQTVSLLPEAVDDVLLELDTLCKEDGGTLTLTDGITGATAPLTLPDPPEQRSKLQQELTDNQKKAFKLRDNSEPSERSTLKRQVLLIKPNMMDEDYIEAEHSIRFDTESIPWEQLALKEGMTLFDYQQECVQWLLISFLAKPGVLLADDMGLGKTFQTLAFIRLISRWGWQRYCNAGSHSLEAKWNPNAFQQTGSCPHPILLVVPPILLENFEKQATDFFTNADEFQFKVLSGTELKAYRKPECKQTRGNELTKRSNSEALATPDMLDLHRLQQHRCIIVTYDTLSNYQFSFAKMDWALLICDEVQKAKNCTTNVSNALKAVASKARFKVMMSGTPVENDMGELWNIIDTAYAGVLDSLQTFRKEYKPLFDTSLAEEQAQSLTLLKQRLRFGDYVQGIANGRLKEEVYRNSDKLPKLHSHTERIPTTLEEQEQLRDYLTSERPILQKLCLIKQSSLHPFLVASNTVEEAPPEAWLENNLRLKRLFERLDAIHAQGEKALVFCEYHAYQHAVQALINQRYTGQPALKPINSLLTTKTQQLQAFQTQVGFAALVLSPKCAGMGLNLQEANHVFHLSRWWNPAVEDQATCRAYRTGQTKPVHVYYFVADDFFENNLHDRLEQKRNMRQGLFDLSYLQDIDPLSVIADVLPSKTTHTLASMDVITGSSKAEQGKQFETVVKEVLLQQGYVEVKRPTHGDNGLDWIATDTQGIRYGVQVKHVAGGGSYGDWGKLERFSETLHNHNLEQGLFVTNGTISHEHQQRLSRASRSIKCIDRTILEAWLAV